jgi:hypothetical protein
MAFKRLLQILPESANSCQKSGYYVSSLEHMIIVGISIITALKESKTIENILFKLTVLVSLYSL